MNENAPYVAPRDHELGPNDVSAAVGSNESLDGIKNRFFEQLPIQLEVHVAADVLKETKVTVLHDQIGDAFIYQLAMMVQGDVTVEQATFPASWWDAVKLRWTPSFLKKYVKANAIVVDTKVTYNFFPGIGVQ